MGFIFAALMSGSKMWLYALADIFDHTRSNYGACGFCYELDDIFDRNRACGFSAVKHTIKAARKNKLSNFVIPNPMSTRV